MGALRWGVIGLGRAGLAKIKAIEALGPRNASIVAVASRRALPHELSERYPSLAHVTWEELVSSPEIDAVAICTENELHGLQARAALSSGKHTLVDFPLCFSSAEFDELSQLAAQRKRLLHQELIGLIAPSHRLLTAQLRAEDPVSQLSIHFQGGLKAWVRAEAQASRWGLLALGRLQRAWALAGPLRLLKAELNSAPSGAYTLSLLMEGEAGSEVRLVESRGLELSRQMSLELVTRSGAQLHHLLPQPLPRPERPLFELDLSLFSERVEALERGETVEHYVPELAQRGVMELIDELGTRLELA